MPQWKVLIEYLLSERAEALNSFVYANGNSPEHSFAYGLELGKVRMIDAFISLPGLIKSTKLRQDLAERSL
jgi:hypothetical protein